MPVDPLTLYLNESTGLTGPALDRCKKYEIKKRMDLATLEALLGVFRILYI